MTDRSPFDRPIIATTSVITLKQRNHEVTKSAIEFCNRILRRADVLGIIQNVC